MSMAFISTKPSHRALVPGVPWVSYACAVGDVRIGDVRVCIECMRRWVRHEVR
jgi:hypothetical protein